MYKVLSINKEKNNNEQHSSYSILDTTYNIPDTRRAGQSTLELLIALAILLISISAVIALFFGGQSILIDTQMSNQGGYLARQALEIARSTARTNFSSLSSSSSTINDFSVQTIVTLIDTYTKNVTSLVTWQTDPLRVQTLELVAILTDWRNVYPPADPNDPPGGSPSGDWMNPRTLGTADLAPSGNQGTGVDVVGNYAYVTAEMPSADKPDFFIANVSSPSSPSIISSINTGPGLNAVDATLGYAFVANRSNTKQLQVINITTPGTPTLAAEFSLPNTSGNNATGRSVFYSPPYVYVGTGNASGPEFHIVNVSTPTNPTSAGKLEIGADVNAIIVRGSFAYLATSDVYQELTIINVTNPALPTQIGGLNLPSNGAGTALGLSGNTLYLTRNSNTDKEFFVLDISNPSSVQILGSKEFGADLPGYAMHSCLGFIGSTDSNKEFQVHNIANPTSITEWSSFDFPQVVANIDYRSNLVYTAVRSNRALRIITSGVSPSQPCN